MQLTIEQAIQQAIEHHREGRLPDAERMYRAILHVQPMHPDANHNLGVLAMQVKNVPAALPHFKAALEANPAQGQYWLSYIDALIHANRPDDARTVLEQGRSCGLNGEAVDAIALRLQTAGSAERTLHESTPPSEVNDAHSKPKGQSKGRGASPLRHQGPSAGEINELVSLFNASRYEDVSVTARRMAERYPRHPLAWKVWGSALQRMGRNAEAVQPMSRCAELSPGDAEAHCNLAIILKELGRFDEAEASCRRALKAKPGFADAQNCLGTVLHALGRRDEAEASFRRTLEMAPGHLDAHIHLGRMLYEAGNLHEAEAVCRRAIALNPAFPVSHNNLGLTLKDLGKLDEATASFRKALELRPDYAFAQFNLAETYCYLDDMQQAAHAYERVHQLASSGMGLDALAYRAVLHYLESDLERCEMALQGTRTAAGYDESMHKNARIYAQYLARLVSWHRQRNGLQRAANGESTLFVIGESHALSPHRMEVTMDADRAVCRAKWISGCKQWHLGNAKDNAYKRKFEALAAKLPSGVAVLTMIGEIDCRLDEGILAAARKATARGLQDIIRDTASGYVDYLGKTAALGDKKVIVAGVPAANAALLEAKPAELEELSVVIRTFNAVLKERALHAGMGFLDLFALTDRGDGASAGAWHIDAHHLLPSAVPEAFQRFYYPAALRT